MNSIKAGDIFRWEYIEEKQGQPYRCKSQIAEAFYDEKTDSIKLFDTYWNDRPSSLTRTFSLDEVGKTISLTFIANRSDLDKVYSDSCFADYSDKDCINLSHSNNSGRWFIRKGAKKDAEKIKRRLIAHIERYEEKAKDYGQRAKRLEEVLNNFDENDPDKHYIPNDKDVYW